MIVKCEQCQTRFKIPDDKVTDKGVKVRCTKCSHTFRVTRDMAQPATAPASAAPAGDAPDPFARFGAPATPSNIDVTRPGVFALGVEATRTPEAPRPAPGGFDFGSLAPPASVPPAVSPPARAAPAPVPPLRSGPAAFDFSAPAAAAPAPVARAPVGPPPAAAQTPAFDFSSLGVPPAPGASSAPAPASAYDFTQPAVPAFVPPPPPQPAAPGGGFDFSSLVPPAQPASPGFAPPPPAETSGQQAGGYGAQAGGYDYAAQNPQAGGYDYAAQNAPAGGYDYAAQSAQGGGYDYAAQSAQGGGYDYAAQNAQAGGYDYSAQNAQAGGFDASAQAPAGAGFDFASVAPPAAPGPASAGFDFSALAPPAPGAAGSMPPGVPAYPGGPSAPDAATQQVAALQPNADPFAAAAGAAMSKADARAMFDMPVAPPAAPASPLADLPPPEPDPVPAPVVAAMAPATPTPSLPPPGADEPRARRNVVGIVVNVAIAAVLVLGLVVVGSAFLNEGKVSGDSLSLENLKNTFAPSTPLVARDVSNGLYETKAGRAVFFVRGEVVNRTGETVNVVVRAELVEGETVVRGAESWAGTPPTPEELFLVDGNEALEALNKKVEQRAVAVPPGGAMPFVVTFTEYPPDLKDFRVRVTARTQPRAPTAANP